VTTVVRGQPTSAEVRATLAAEGRPVLVAFSGGKDAIAAALALRDVGVPIHLAHLYLIPGREPGRPLAFVEQGLRDLEQSLGLPIHRYPHPSLYRWLNQFVFQPPERIATIRAAAFPTPTYEEVWSGVRRDLGLDHDTWIADGVRAADSIVRRASFVKHGVMKVNNRKVSPIHDWLQREVYDRIEAERIELPVDYELFKRSFDGIDHRFLAPVAERFPDDFARILDWFPLAELELIRHGL
jgi:3'-phosphoadenosine 5'-phosphosulfate sulfotransferase (PAPS reductase)/FAD synthetase